MKNILVTTLESFLWNFSTWIIGMLTWVAGLRTTWGSMLMLQIFQSPRTGPKGKFVYDVLPKSILLYSAPSKE